jgi:hypothetical protein
MLLAMGGPAEIRRSPREAPGVVLQKTKVQILDRSGPDYKRNVLEYNRTRGEFLRALASHPTGRSLALLALGPQGVRCLEEGRLPKWPTGSWVTLDRELAVKQRGGYERTPIRRPIFPRRGSLPVLGYNLRSANGKPVQYPPTGEEKKHGPGDGFQCHHVVQKSTRSLQNPQGVNDPSNLVVVQTLGTNNNARNWHHYWHAGFLHPQTHLPAGSLATVYFVRPLFPIYPPIRQAFRTPQEVQEALQKLDPKAKLPQAWARRLVAFSEAVGHTEPFVPEGCREAIRAFQAIHCSRDRTPEGEEKRRRHAAELGAPWAQRYLPEGALLPETPVAKEPDRRVPLTVVPEPPLVPVGERSGETSSAKSRRSQGKACSARSRHAPRKRSQGELDR